MIPFWIFISIICLIYLFLIFSILIGWFRIKEFRGTDKQPVLFLSVVIPVRNEEANIHNLLNDLVSQEYPKEKFEVLIVDDHSDDDTYKLIKNFKSVHQIRILQLPDEKSGKRAALIEGITEAKSDLVLITDGDCRLKKSWISDMAGYYSSRSSKLIFGAVLHPASKKIGDMIQNLEFLSLVTSSAGLAGVNRPILCNAANMGFERKLYLQFANHVQTLTVSGDDVFFLHWVKQRYPDEIHFLKSRSSFVETSYSKSATDFFNQRVRWTSKSRYYRDPSLIITAIVVFVTSFLLMVLLVGAIFSKLLLQGFMIVFMVKCVANFIFLYTTTSFYKTRYLLRIFIPVELLYFFYITITGIGGNLFAFTWKGRKSKPVLL